MPAIKSERTQPLHFLAERFDASDPEALTRMYDDLDSQDVSTKASLEKFISDWDEMSASVYEARMSSYVDMTSDTNNPDFEAKYTKIVEQILPISEQRDFNLKRKLVASPALDDLGDEYGIYLRQVRAEMDIFREENVPLQTEERKLDQEFQKISGNQKVEFRGETYTMAQMQPFQEQTDRQTREEAFRARAQAKLADADKFDEIFDKMYEVRAQIARNAGFDNYRDYKFKELKRFDYTPEDCEAFHKAIEKHVVPVVTQNNDRRKRLLGIDSLRPWDLQVDAEGKEPLKPFKDVEELKAGCERIFTKIDPELGAYFRQMIEDNLLDLENRPGKAPGGYMDAFASTQVPFIYMNAVGTHRDVETLLHEGGHSFHYFLSRKLPLFNYQLTGIGSEIAEVASMSMEYLCRPYLSEFYNEEEIERLHDEKLRDSMQWFPFMAMIDAFQHWVYTAEDHSAKARRTHWAELERRFRPDLDWIGLEQFRDIGWQYLHVFSSPLYFVEYAIAQLAAMRIWLNSLEDEKGAVDAYKRGLALGGSRPLPELFSAAGAEFGLNDQTVRAIVAGTLAQMSSNA